jgi:DNA repair protein RecN (Recombination protein N)
MHIVSDSYQTLYEKEDAALSNIALCIKRIEKGTEMDSRLGGIRDAIASAHVEMEDAALDLRNLQKSIIIDPRRLEDVDERLQFINRLKRKYGESIEEILVFRDKISKMVENLDQMRHNLEKINHETGEMEKEVASKSTLLSMKRKGTAKDLENAMKQELQMLEMGGTQFEVKFHSMDAGEGDASSEGDAAGHIMGEIKAEGYDRVEFMLSPNIGEDLRPLSRIASGGELSRIMLAMKTILARTASVETIIFDEVDAGISGATAEVVGEKLQSLAEYHQTLCITHLPQIASKGNTHFLVKKEVITGRTQTVISKLDSEERVKEIARLLGGRIISQKAVAHAREMLG